MGLSVLLAPLQNLLSTFQLERHYKDEKKDIALAAINKALLETKRYLECGGEERVDREREFELAGLWADAAAKSRYASNEIARRLQDKSLYWSGTLKWSREEVLMKQIDFDSIERTISELLGT
jgi:hypothetical protein